MIKVYLDTCLYNRPFDDQRRDRIFIEARAFYVVIKLIEEGKIVSINSDALEYENSLTSNYGRQIKVKTYLGLAGEYVELSSSVIERAREIVGFSIRDIDALHIAMAEKAKADYFVTCDDSIVKKAKKCQRNLKVKICGILEFLEEVLYCAKNNG